MLEELQAIPIIADVNSDQQNHGLQAMVQYDRATAARFGISPQLIDNTLYDAFGQRQVSTMYTSLNQYHVVMEAAPQFWQNPEIPEADLRVRSPNGRQVPLSAFAHFAPDHGAAGGELIRVCSPPSTHLVQSAAGRRAWAMPWTRSTRPPRKIGLPPYHPDRFRRHGAGLSGFARQRTDADRRRAGHRLHRAGHSLRELHPPHHDPLHAAFGRRGRAAGAACLPRPISASSPSSASSC